MEHIWDSYFKCGTKHSMDSGTINLSGEKPMDLNHLISSLEFEKHFVGIPS